jgi:DNA polymerase I-like protein with 3'-5' exonuclease and polymerase domains
MRIDRTHCTSKTGRFTDRETETQDLFENIEVPLISVLADMEREGVQLDVENLKNYSNELEKDILLVEKEIQDLAGTSFNVGVIDVDCNPSSGELKFQ